MSRAHKHAHAQRRGNGRAVRRREAQYQERAARQEARQAAQMARQRPA
jgi:hypothetical protein